LDLKVLRADSQAYITNLPKVEYPCEVFYITNVPLKEVETGLGLEYE